MASCEIMEPVPERKTMKDMKKNSMKDKRRRKRNDVLNFSKWHNKSSTSFMKATLRANNTALARALEKAKLEVSGLQHCLLELQKERHSLMCAVRSLRHTNLEYEQRFANIRESLRNVTTNLLGASSMLSTTLENCLSPIADRGSHVRISTMSDEDGYENRKISGPSIYYKKPSFAPKNQNQETLVPYESSVKMDSSLDDVTEKNDVISEVPCDENIRISLPSFLNDSAGAVDEKPNSLAPSIIQQDTDVCLVKEQDKGELIDGDNQSQDKPQSGDRIDTNDVAATDGCKTKTNKRLNFSTSFTESTPPVDDSIPKSRHSQLNDESCVGSSVKTINKANSFATFFPLSPKDAKLSKCSAKSKQKNTKNQTISKLVENPFKTQSKIVHSPKTRKCGYNDENQSHSLKSKINLDAEVTQREADTSKQGTANQIAKNLHESETMDKDTCKFETQAPQDKLVGKVHPKRVVSTSNILNNSMDTDILSHDELQYGMFGGCLDRSPDLIGEDMELTVPLNASIVLGALQQQLDKAKKMKFKEHIDVQRHEHELTTASDGQLDRCDRRSLKKTTGNGEHFSKEQEVASNKPRTKSKILKEKSTSESESKAKNDFQEATSQNKPLKKWRKSKPKCKIPKKDAKKPSSVFDLSAGEYFSHPSPSRLSKNLTIENASDKPEIKKNKNQASRRGTFLIPKTKMSQNLPSDSDNEHHHQKHSPLTSKNNELPQEKKSSPEVTSNTDDHAEKKNVDSDSNLDEKITEVQLKVTEKKKSRKSHKKTPKTAKKHKKNITFNLQDMNAEDNENDTIEISNQVSSRTDVSSTATSDTSKTASKEKTTTMPSRKSKKPRRGTFDVGTNAKNDQSSCIDAEMGAENPIRRQAALMKIVDTIALDSDEEPEITIIPDSHMKNSRKKRVIRSILDTDEDDCSKLEDVTVDVNQKTVKSGRRSNKTTDKENIPGNIKEHRKTPNAKKKDKKKASKNKAKVCEDDHGDNVPAVNDQPIPKQKEKKTFDTKCENKTKGRKTSGQVKNEDRCKNNDSRTTPSSGSQPEPVEQVSRPKTRQSLSIEAEGDVLPRQRASRRNGGVVSYKEPSLNSKLRRNDLTCKTGPGNQLSPAKKKSRKSKRVSKSQKRETMTNVTNTIDNVLQEEDQ